MPAKNKRGLGRGLDALIPAGIGREQEAGSGPQAENDPGSTKDSTYQSDSVTETGERIITVNITQVEPNRNQPRKTFDEDSLEELSDSIRQHGILNPLIVQDRQDHYEIIAGERRWRAAKKAGLKEIPVIIRDLTDTEIAEVALIDNIQREDINAIEEAMAFKKLIDDFGYTQDVVAEKVSKSRVAVTNSLRLLKLTEAVRQMVIDGKLTTGHARALISVDDPGEQEKLAEQIFDGKLSVRDTEKLIKDLGKTAPQKRERKRNESLEAVYRQLSERVGSALGTKVEISSKGEGKGVLSIEFYSSDDLEHITDKLMGRGGGDQ